MFHILEKGDHLGLKLTEIKLGKSDGFVHSVSQKNDPCRKAGSSLGKIIVAKKNSYGVCCLAL